MSNSPFLESIRQVMRTKHYSIQTEKTYLLWIKRFIIFNKNRHPEELGEQELTNVPNVHCSHRSVFVRRAALRSF